MIYAIKIVLLRANVEGAAEHRPGAGSRREEGESAFAGRCSPLPGQSVSRREEGGLPVSRVNGDLVHGAGPAVGQAARRRLSQKDIRDAGAFGAGEP